MKKYIVIAVIWAYKILPQCDMGNGVTCLVGHAEIVKDTIRKEFNDIRTAYQWANSIPNKFVFIDEDRLCYDNKFKIDSIISTK